MKKLRDCGFKKSDLDGGVKDKSETRVIGLRERCWDYINAPTEAALDIARETLCVAGGAALRKYINEEWRLKERKTVIAYTRRYPNLGAASSQMSESYHNVMREITNAQLSLEESAKRLAQKVHSIIKDIEADETVSYRAYSRLTQTNTFKSLRMKVTNSALKMIEIEWLEL